MFLRSPFSNFCLNLSQSSWFLWPDYTCGWMGQVQPRRCGNRGCTLSDFKLFVSISPHYRRLIPMPRLPQSKSRRWHRRIASIWGKSCASILFGFASRDHFGELLTFRRSKAASDPQVTCPVKIHAAARRRQMWVKKCQMPLIRSPNDCDKVRGKILAKFCQPINWDYWTNQAGNMDHQILFG